MKLVIGIVGPIGAGKDTAADYLVEKYGFIKFSTSDELRYEWRTRGVENPTRKQMQTLSTELRSKYRHQHRDILTERTWKKMAVNEVERGVILGIRLVDGIDFLRKVLKDKFYLLAISASQQLRFARKEDSQRSDDSDLKQWMKFKVKDDQETSGDAGNAQEVGKVMALADEMINNDGNLEELYQRLDKLLEELN